MNPSSVDAERILQELGGKPIDRVAWRVVQKGEHYERPARQTMMCFDQAPPMRDLKEHWTNNGMRPQDLTGMRSGYLTVIGYWGRSPRSPDRNGTRGRTTQYWVCLCKCGLFTVNKAKALQRIRGPQEEPLMCCACRSDYTRKRIQFKREQGRWPDWRDL